jgi:hypothetical protein
MPVIATSGDVASTCGDARARPRALRVSSRATALAPALGTTSAARGGLREATSTAVRLRSRRVRARVRGGWTPARRDAARRRATVATTRGHSWSIAGWGLDEWGARCSCRELRAGPSDEHARGSTACTAPARSASARRSSARSRCFPSPRAFLPIALDACRSQHAADLRGHRLREPVSGGVLSRGELQSMALKAVFTGSRWRVSSASRPAHARARAHGQRLRDERRAAGRRVPRRSRSRS